MINNNLELIIGPVCSGKSSELIRRIKFYDIAGYNILVVKPSLDSRSTFVESRNGSKIECFSMKNAGDIYDKLVDVSLDKGHNIDIIAFDEAQFYDDLYTVTRDLLQKEYKVMVSALDCDFLGDPFVDIIKLVTLSDDVSKLRAVCMKCKNERAIFSQKLRKGGDKIEIGNLELYHPRCISCFVPGGLDGENDGA